MSPDDKASSHWAPDLLSLARYRKFYYSSCLWRKSKQCLRSNRANCSYLAFCLLKREQAHEVFCTENFSRLQKIFDWTILFYTSDQASRNSYMTDEIPCNSGKSLLLQGILLLVHTGMRSENRPQVTVLRSVRSSAFRASMSRGRQPCYHPYLQRTLRKIQMGE